MNDEQTIEQAIGIPGITITRQFTADLNTDIATSDTVRQMSLIARASAYSGAIHHACSEALANAAWSTEEIARRIYYWVKSKVHYRHDDEVINGKEILFSPDVLLAMPTPSGDCDDFSILISSMLWRMGIENWFVTVAGDPQSPGKLTHIYVAAIVADRNGKERRVSLDGSHGHYFGWEVEAHRISRKVEWR